MKTFSTNRQGHIWWAIAFAALLYVFAAQQPLVQTSKVTPISVLPIAAENPALQSGSIYTEDKERSFEMDVKERLLWMSGSQGRRLLPIYGYPYIAGKRYFILRPDQQGATEIDADGKFRWALEFGTPITASSISSSISAWGLLDGSIQILDGHGRLLNEIKPSLPDISSAYGCIYGVAVSAKGGTVAAIYGRDSQYFLVYEKSGDKYSLSHARKLDAQVTSAQNLAFSSDDAFVLGRTADGLVFCDVARKKSQIVYANYFSGEAEAQIEPIGKDEFAFLLAKADGRFAGLIRNGAIEAAFPVDNGCTNLSALVDGFLLSSRDSEFRYKVER